MTMEPWTDATEPARFSGLPLIIVFVFSVLTSLAVFLLISGNLGTLWTGKASQDLAATTQQSEAPPKSDFNSEHKAAAADTLETSSIASQAPSPAKDDGIERALLPLRSALTNSGPSVDRVNALFAFNVLLSNYGAKHKNYPNSEGRLVPAGNALDVLGDPEYRKHVPQNIIAQIQYVSNGSSYKVIITGSGDCAVVRALRPAMVDPKRSSGLDCIAYGYWSPLGANF